MFAGHEQTVAPQESDCNRLLFSSNATLGHYPEVGQGDIDIHEGDKLDEAALKDLIRAAVVLNLKGKNKPKPKPEPRRAGSKRAD